MAEYLSENLRSLLGSLINIFTISNWPSYNSKGLDCFSRAGDSKNQNVRSQKMYFNLLTDCKGTALKQKKTQTSGSFSTAVVCGWFDPSFILSICQSVDWGRRWTLISSQWMLSTCIAVIVMYVFSYSVYSRDYRSSPKMLQLLPISFSPMFTVWQLLLTVKFVTAVWIKSHGFFISSLSDFQLWIAHCSVITEILSWIHLGPADRVLV